MREPSDRMLNHVVNVKHKVGDCGFGPGTEHRAAIRPLSEKDLAVLNIEVDSPQMKVYFREDVQLDKGDRIEYTDKGEARYIRVETYYDQMMMGRLFTAFGSDFQVE